jgi:hypothetical protein
MGGSGGGGATSLLNGHTPATSGWLVITDFPATSYAAVEHFRQQLQMQVNKMASAAASGEVSGVGVRCQWHPLQRWLLVSVMDAADMGHIQALLQSQFMATSRVELLTEKQARQYFNQLRQLVRGIFGGG